MDMNHDLCDCSAKHELNTWPPCHAPWCSAWPKNQKNEEQTKKTANDLRMERDRLAAQNRRLQSVLSHVEDYALNRGADPDSECMREIKAALKETPAVSLAEIQAQTINKMMLMIYHEEDDHRGYYNSEAITHYAERIRQQAKESNNDTP